MKKIISSMFILIFGLCLVGCVDTPNGPGSEDPYPDGKYKLTVIDDFGYVIEPLETYYKEGQKVEVHLPFLSGPSVGININGEYISESAETKHIDGHPVITFIMPNKDSILYTTMNGYILKDCGEGNHKWDDGREIESGNGGYVIKHVCKLCGKSNEQIITIIPPEEEIFYSLQEAFYKQFLTHRDLEQIANYNNNIVEEELPKIDSIIAEKIIEDFCKYHNVDYENNPGSVRCFGEYNGYYAVMVDGCGLEYLTVIDSETVDDITFIYGSSQHILIWKYND